MISSKSDSFKNRSVIYGLEPLCTHIVLIEFVINNYERKIINEDSGMVGRASQYSKAPLPYTHNRGTEGVHYPGQPSVKCLVQQHKQIFSDDRCEIRPGDLLIQSHPPYKLYHKNHKMHFKFIVIMKLV